MLDQLHSIKLASVDSVVNRVLAVEVNLINVKAVFNEHFDDGAVSLFGSVEEWRLFQVIFGVEVNSERDEEFEHV